MPNAKKCYISFIYRSRRSLKMWEWLDLKIDLKMQPGKCLESMILRAFVRMSICSHILYYSKHHGAEKWDLEFGSNTTGFFFKHHGKKWKLTRRMILHAFVWLSICSHIFPQMYSLFPQWRCVSSGFMEKESICDTQQLSFMQPNNLVFCCTLICDTWF